MAEVHHVLLYLVKWCVVVTFLLFYAPFLMYFHEHSEAF